MDEPCTRTLFRKEKKYLFDRSAQKRQCNIGKHKKNYALFIKKWKVGQKCSQSVEKDERIS